MKKLVIIGCCLVLSGCGPDLDWWHIDNYRKCEKEVDDGRVIHKPNVDAFECWYVHPVTGEKKLLFTSIRPISETKE